MRWVYLGTPQYAATILHHLLEHQWRPTLVVTQPDRPAGRNRQLTPPPAKVVALDAGLPVFQPEKITVDARERILAERPDVIIVAAYGKILRPALLAAPPLGCVNAHASLLPAFRGAAPVNWALARGESETGVTMMLMDEGIDTGPILAKEAIPIAPEDDAGSLLVKLADLAGPLTIRTLRAWADGKIRPTPQPAAGASYAPPLTKDDGRIDWSRPADVLVNHVRGMNPWPGGQTAWRGKSLKVLRAQVVPGVGRPGEVLQAHKELVVATGAGALRLLELQLEGKKALDASSFLNGVHLRSGDVLGEA